jgi:Family of unknown function (DUF6459)
VSVTTLPAPTASPALQPPPIRWMPVPCCEPPYDDELVGGRGSVWGRGGAMPQHDPSIGVQGMLALSFTLPTGVPAVPEAPPALRLVNSLHEAETDWDDFGPRPTGRAGLPEPRSWAGRVIQAIVEVLAGVRPASQLVRWTTAEVYDEISSRVLPVRAAVELIPARGVVSSVHVTEPADGVAEVCALVRRGARSTAVALRLEGLDGRWQCTALELG